VDALEAIRHRRAVRRYTDQPVAEVDVARLLRLALLAPTGHGAQAWGFVVVRDGARRAALVRMLDGAAECFRISRPAAEGVGTEGTRHGDASTPRKSSGPATAARPSGSAG